MTLRYMIIGAGGTGAPLGAFLAKNGADVTLIARGAHLAAMQEKGLRFEQSDGETWTVPVKAFDMDGFLAAKAQGAPSPDVIFVCVKGYSLDDTIPFIRSAAGEKTVVILTVKRFVQCFAPKTGEKKQSFPASKIFYSVALAQMRRSRIPLGIPRAQERVCQKLGFHPDKT